MGIFGTDGVRGIGHVDSVDDPLHSFDSGRLFTKELCSEIVFSASKLADAGAVIIGWDRRPSNLELAKSAIDSLSKTGRKIMVLEETTTPALQYAMLAQDAKLGVMITASHNPSEDTGVKILFENGRKPTVEEESAIENGLFSGTRDRGAESEIEHISNKPYIQRIRGMLIDFGRRGMIPDEGFLVDGSGGWISAWLADMISEAGFPCRETSDRDAAINLNCGAGSLSEGDVIEWDECRESDHSLLRMLRPSPRGSVLGFCFDGDGDRCFLISSNGDGALVIGGDGFMRLFSQGYTDEKYFSAALTIESALDVSENLRSLGNGRVTETGVGDRWLQHALMNDLKTDNIVGAEPSGHVILKHEIGSKTGLWGDGVKTMLEFLRLIDSHGQNWSEIASSSTSLNLTYSIYPSNRALWDPDGESGKLVLDAIVRSLNTDAEGVRRVDVEGESGLLLLRHSGEAEWSFAIRNSGTESKTRVTLRTAGGTRDESDRVMEAMIDVLEPMLKSDSTS